MGVMPVNKLLITMSLPIMISMLIQALYNIVDSLFVARINENALTAVSLAFPVQTLFIGVAVGTGVGVNALLSKYLGEKNQAGVDKTAANGIFVSFITYLFFLVFGLLFYKQYFKVQTTSAEIIQYGEEYLLICLIFSIGVLESIVLERILQGTGKTIFTMIAQSAGAILNIVLDPILIFGWFGIPRMGIAGAAIATVIGQMAGMFLNIYFNLRYNHEVHISFRGFRPDGTIINQIYKVGVPSIAMQCVASVMTFGLNKIVISYTETAAAVIGIYYKIQSFVFMPVFGMNNAMVPILAYNYGAKNPKRINQTVRYGLMYGMVIMVLGMILMEVFAVPLMAMFNASDEMMNIGVTALRIIGIGYLVSAVSVVLGAVFQALGNGVESLIATIFRQVVILLPAAYLLARIWGLHALWWAFPMSELGAGILCAILWKRIYKNKIKKLA